MTETNLWDMVVDELKERHRMTKEELHKRFKKTNPFRMEPVSKAQTAQEFAQIDPEVQQALRQDFGDDTIDSYLGGVQ